MSIFGTLSVFSHPVEKKKSQILYGLRIYVRSYICGISSVDRWQRSQGALLINRLGDFRVDLETVRDKWEAITAMEDGDFPESNQSATMDLVGKMEGLSAEGGADQSTGDGPVCKL